MTYALIVGSSMMYTLIAVRVGFVFWRLTKDSGGDRVTAATCGLLWPLLIIGLGFGVMISGQAGIYGHKD